MAPRGRRPRKRNTRLDAAVDAMGAMGFQEDFVRETMNELLQTYSEDGWLLIEDNSYEVLRETLLEKQERLDKEQQEGQMIAESSAGPSTVPALPPCSGGVDTNDQKPQHNVAPEEAMPMIISQRSEALLPDHTIIGLPGGEEKTHEGDSSNTRSPTPLRFEQPYKPSYGWISGNNEQVSEDDIITLEPMSIEEFKKLYYFRMGLHQPQRKRKPRWDVRPDS